MPVTLRALDESTLPLLLAAAVEGAEPDDVMPPLDGPPGWTEARREAFRAFHRARSIATADPVESTWVIRSGDDVVGAARLQPVLAGVEMGIWLSRRARGRGVGRAAAELLVARARAEGYAQVVASTTAGNHAAVRLLDALGASLTGNDGAVDAVVPL
ncbi:MAG: GNAT family N-acetyltransferase [Pseudonocardia sp.]|nr:GNAT family N-acetyltransferase [Pseudonocardia sp.]